MKLAFCLYKYFPFGGLQRDFFRTAETCAARGHEVHVYVRSWEGDIPDWLTLHVVNVKSLTNPGKDRKYYHKVQSEMKGLKPDLVVGFNRMPGLDVYFAADPCYAAKVDAAGKGKWYRASSRYKHYMNFERSLFADNHTRFFVLTDKQKEEYQQYYATPEAQFYKLPPGIGKDRRAGDDAEGIRAEFRREFNIAHDQKILLLLGSGFKTKGLDRAINVLAMLPDPLKSKTCLFVVGKDNEKPFVDQAKALGVEQQITFFQGRDDVPRFLQGADLLIHPAYSEAAGMVLLESIVAGLPVAVSDVCGFSHYIEDAKAGFVEPSPFDVTHFSQQIASALEHSSQLELWKKNGIEFGKVADIYSLADRACQLIESFVNEGDS